MRLIDGDALKRKAQKVATESWMMKIKGNVETILNQFIDWIDASPTIEPERKTGKWITEIEDWRGQIVWVKCSLCGFDASTEYRFCPNCGSFNGGGSDAQTN